MYDRLMLFHLILFSYFPIGKSVELEQLSLMISNGGSLVHHQIGIAAAGNCSSNVSQKKVRKSIKSFFGGANKFQKIMKPSGIYFASLIYHEPRILVTNEEVLPLIEIGKSIAFNIDSVVVVIKHFNYLYR